MRKGSMPFLIAGMLIVIVLPSVAQFSNVMISNQNNCNEPSIYMNPKNTNQLVAGANLSAFYYSNDGGYTWGNANMTSPLGVAGDPCLVIDTAGYFYYLHLSNPEGIPLGWLDRIVCQRSVNHGLSWNEGSSIGMNSPKQQDKEWAAVNPFNNEIYVTWTQFDSYGVSDTSQKTNILFSRSSDQGMTWTTPIRLNEVSGDCIDSDNTVEGAVPAVGPGGEIYTSWAGPAGIVFDRSLDGGATWLDSDIPIDPMPGGWDYTIPGIFRTNGMPVTACDLSNGPYRGTIYINWSDQRNGPTDTDIWLKRSTDGGNTWSQAIRVNDDVPGRQQFFTWMTVDPVTGYVWIVFYDRRNYEDNRTDIYLAVSTDGGLSFSNFKISETPFIPYGNVFFGDYTCITAHNGKVRPIWTRLDGYNLSIYTAIVDTLITSAPSFPDFPYALEQNYPNPFSESTVFPFRIRRQGYVSLTVMDLLGHRVATLMDKKWLLPGKYVEVFTPGNINLPSGVYYFLLEAEGHNRYQKVIYQK